MVRHYLIKWVSKNDRLKMERTTEIKLNDPTGLTEIDAKCALNIFTKNFGNLTKNDIICIKEIGENGQIGEDIVPTTTSILPTGK